MEAATVYVVEDDDAVRESVTWMLQQEGLHVVACREPQSLLHEFEPIVPSCLVLDLFLPQMSALELYARLLARGQQLPFIIVTGHGEIADACEAMRHGAIDFLEKPIDRDTLIAKIWQALALDLIQRGQPAETSMLLRFAQWFIRANHEMMAVPHRWRLHSTENENA